MINLIINYYLDKDRDRQLELEECLRRNAANQHIDRIICLLQEEVSIEHNNAHTIVVGKRPTYNDLFSYAMEGSWNVVANTDIYFDDSLKFITDYTESDFLALARYDLAGEESEFRFMPDTQDTWIFYGKVKPINANFNQGIPGCDNSLAYLAQKAGYRVINPSLKIKSYHLHRSNIRHYTLDYKIPGPYLTIWPTE